MIIGFKIGCKLGFCINKMKEDLPDSGHSIRMLARLCWMLVLLKKKKKKKRTHNARF